MSITNQDQHKIPRVYLKKFGYRDKNNHWKLSVIKNGKKSTQQKTIKSFTAVTNLFDISSDDQRVRRIIEQFNCQLETEYNNIIKDLEEKKTLSEKSYAVLLNLIANLIVRADYWREWLLGIMNHENKENFIKLLLARHTKGAEDFNKITEKHYYRLIVDAPNEQAVNRVLIYFIDHFLLRFRYYEIVIIQSQEEKEWWTSTNPVVMHQRMHEMEIFAKESEIYFPLSPKYLIYLHFKGSDDKENELRKLETNKIHVATDEQNTKLQHYILENPSEYVIIAGEYHHTVD